MRLFVGDWDDHGLPKAAGRRDFEPLQYHAADILDDQGNANTSRCIGWADTR